MWTYAIWAFEFLVYPPLLFITVALFVNLIASTIRQRPFSSVWWKKTYWILVAQFFLFVATIAVAAVGRVDWQQPHFPGPNRLALPLEDSLGIGSPILGTYWTWRMAGMRWFASSVTLVALWLLAAANFIAAMSLTGTWL